MPGAVRKFNLMPKLVYDQEELRLIAEALYDIDYGSSPKMRMNKDLRLNNGKKWKLTNESLDQINVVKESLANFNSTAILDYNQLGKDVFNEAKLIMLDESYKGEVWDQIHNFFSDIEDDMHTLMATQSMDEAANELTILKIKCAPANRFPAILEPKDPKTAVIVVPTFAPIARANAFSYSI